MSTAIVMILGLALRLAVQPTWESRNGRRFGQTACLRQTLSSRSGGPLSHISYATPRDAALGADEALYA